MTQREDVLRILARHPDGLTDAEILRELKALHPRAIHQTVNTICRGLSTAGMIIRDDADSPIINRLPRAGTAPEQAAPAQAPPAAPSSREGTVADVLVASDTPAQRAHREHQSRWRETVLGLPPGPPSRPFRSRYPALGNYLPETAHGLTAEQTGWNLMSPAARAYTRRRLDALRRVDGLAEPDRLWRNMLSSQPLAFSVAGELRAHPKAAVAVFAELTGRPVAGLAAIGGLDDDHRLDGIEAEWFPPRELHTRDRSGFDIAAALRLADRSRILLTIEVKYVDGFSRAPLEPPHYSDHLAATRLTDAVPDIVRAGG
ncbi:MAG TPA: hypothetical protein VD813_11270, partial [Pseudonocardia sp.]|nr:hypothetical protein [Pseudonocardia sp.]